MSVNQYTPAAASIAAGLLSPAADQLRAALESIPVVELAAAIEAVWACDYCGEFDGSPVEVWDAGEPELGISGGIEERCSLCVKERI